MKEKVTSEEQLKVELPLHLNADLIQTMLALIWRDFLENKTLVIDTSLPIKYFKIEKRGSLTASLGRGWIEVELPILLIGYRAAKSKKPGITFECNLKLRTSGEISPENLGIDKLDIEIGKSKGYFFSGWVIPISKISAFLMVVFRKKIEGKLISQIHLGWQDVYAREKSKVLDWITQNLIYGGLPENYSLTKVYITPGIPGEKLWTWQLKGLLGKLLSSPVEVVWEKGLQGEADNMAIVRIPYGAIPDLVPEFSFTTRGLQVGLILSELKEAEGKLIADMNVNGALRGSLMIEIPLDLSGNVHWNLLEVSIELKSKNLLTLGVALFKRKTIKAIEEKLKEKLSIILNPDSVSKTLNIQLVDENQLTIGTKGPSEIGAFDRELKIRFDLSLEISPVMPLKMATDNDQKN